MSDLLERITVNPKQCGGRPCIRGMRIRVSDVLDLFAAGLSAEEILGRLAPTWKWMMLELPWFMLLVN